MEKTSKNTEMLNGWARSKLSDELMLIGIDINYDGIYEIEQGRSIVKDFELSAIAKLLEVDETELLKDFKKKLGK